MEVFISWSGDRSEAVAKALRDWIPNVIQSVKPWMSAKDIEKGARWSSEIADHLNASQVGISCLTPENLEAPWLLFEAGAMSKKLQKPFVCTYLFDLKPTDVSEPLAQFQATTAEKEDTLKLMRTINEALGEAALKEDQLVAAFEKWWPDLDAALRKIPDPEEERKPQRDTREFLEEILALVREQTRSIGILSAAVYLPRTGLGSLLPGSPSEVGGGFQRLNPMDVYKTMVASPSALDRETILSVLKEALEERTKKPKKENDRATET